MLDNQDKKTALDFEQMWSQMKLPLPIAEGFAASVEAIAERYQPTNRRIAPLPSRERKAIYDKLNKSVTSLLDQLSSLPPSIQ
ncbi:hypothetical protein [uncultured Ruegeria sp.]|uniref:hypothetical protein n=1 Tax=uncultured Ruegeria sp. TaxID=259304 RepID=UPI00263A0A15|nr:hypothetical protein [uncultured Ruegeria sp.]